jgi:hypothetical protein
MLADLDAREADQEQFREWWDSWGYGEGDDRELIPKDPTWRQSVDQIVAAGLPLRVLKDCIDLSMSRRRVGDDQKFRYMCGVAWKKVGELQEAASQQRDGSPRTPASAKSTIQWVLQFFTPAAIEAAERSIAEDEDPTPPGEHELEVLLRCVITATTDLQWTQAEVLMLLDRLPDDVGAQAQQVARTALYDGYGATFTQAQFIDRAVISAIEILDPESVPF